MARAPRDGAAGRAPAGWSASSSSARLEGWLRRAVADDRGDVPGWVLVTLMTAGLVLGLWAVADTALQDMFTEAMESVRGRG